MKSFLAPFVSLLVATSVMHYQPPEFMTHDDSCRAWISESINADKELPILGNAQVAQYAISKYSWKWKGELCYMVVADFSATILEAAPDYQYHKGDSITGRCCVLFFPDQKKTVITSINEFLQNAERVENDEGKTEVFGFPTHQPAPEV